MGAIILGVIDIDFQSAWTEPAYTLLGRLIDLLNVIGPTFLGILDVIGSNYGPDWTYWGATWAHLHIFGPTFATVDKLLG